MQVRKESFKTTWGLANVMGEPVKSNFYLVRFVLNVKSFDFSQEKIGPDVIEVWKDV